MFASLPKDEELEALQRLIDKRQDRVNQSPTAENSIQLLTSQRDYYVELYCQAKEWEQINRGVTRSGAENHKATADALKVKIDNITHSIQSHESERALKVQTHHTWITFATVVVTVIGLCVSVYFSLHGSVSPEELEDYVQHEVHTLDDSSRERYDQLHVELQSVQSELQLLRKENELLRDLPKRVSRLKEENAALRGDLHIMRDLTFGKSEFFLYCPLSSGSGIPEFYLDERHP